ncbi:hypothetical protein QFC21_001492 [Naganishia friedmannii]|uniref:Uncharacterized protein n=1 Tax=Naganishia friedmannii TaxID=89922 RepID=A0ACC2W661_9TREE|nr:hypothetical protein QFC21_001492 [Naganishia friedmannii]
MMDGYVMERQTLASAKPSTTPPITTHSFVPTFTSSSSPSCSSANSLPYLSEAMAEVDEDDLFLSASTDSKQRSDSFSTSSTGSIRRYDEGDFDVRSQSSPTKTGGIPVELALFSDGEEDSLHESEGVITYQRRGGEVPSQSGLQRQQRSQRISRMSPVFVDIADDSVKMANKQHGTTTPPHLIPSFAEVDMFDDDTNPWSPRGITLNFTRGKEGIGKNLQVPDPRQGRSAGRSAESLGETPQLPCTKSYARPPSPTDPVLAGRSSGTSTTSSVDISLCTPYSPTALSEFDFFAKTFPLPLNRDQSGEVTRDDVSDFPVGIPLPGDETGELAAAKSSWSDILHSSPSCAREDLALWRSQCHLSGTSQSTTSLPATLTILPPSASKRNSSVVSLPMSLPDLTDSTATSTTFNWSARGNSDWPSGSSQPPGMHRDYYARKNEKEPDLQAQNIDESGAQDYHTSIFPEPRYVISTSDLTKSGLASPLTFPVVAGSISYSTQPLPQVPEESPSKMDSSTSPLFTMSPMRPDDSPAAHSIYSGRIVSTATSNKLTYLKSQIVDVNSARPLSVPSSINSSPGRTLSSLPPTTAGSNGSSTFGIHRAYLVPETSTKGLGLIHESNEQKSNAEQEICQSRVRESSQYTSSPSSVVSLTNRRKKHRTDLQEPWASQRIPSTPPPPQGPLPQPGGPIDGGYASMNALGSAAALPVFNNRSDGNQKSVQPANSDTQLKGKSRFRILSSEYRFSGISVSVGHYPRSPKSSLGEDNENHEDTLRQAPHLSSPLDSVRDINKSRSTSSFCSSNPSAGDSADDHHRSNGQISLPHTPRDFAWGVHGAKHQRDRVSAYRNTAFASHSLTSGQDIRSSSSSAISSSKNDTPIPAVPATDSDPGLLQTSSSETAFTHPYAASRTFLRNDYTSRTPNGVLSEMTTTMHDANHIRLRSPLATANAFVKDSGERDPVDTGNLRYETGQLSVVSQESSRDPDEDTCPICVESLSASYRLPGERAHIVPECGHALHEACFVEVYGPVPVSYSARQRELGVCGICRAPMRLGDEDDMPRSSSKMGGGNKFAAMMGLETEGAGDKSENRMRGTVNSLNRARRSPLPTSSSTTSFSSSMHHIEGYGDDPLELEGTLLPSARIQHSTNAGVVIPAISVKSEFTALSRKAERNVKQTVTCLVTVQVPQAGKRERYPAPTMIQTPSKSRSTDRLTASVIPHRKASQDETYPAISAATSPSAGHPGADNFSHIAADLKSRMSDYKASGIDNLGRIRLFDILRVRKGAFVLDISVYLFQHALVCVTEEKKKGLRGFLNSPSSYSSLRPPSAERGSKKEKGVLKLKGRIYFKHVKRVLDTSIAGDLSLTITMEDERMDSFILTFRDKDSMDLWRRSIIEAVQEIKADVQPRPTSPMSPPTSASGSITSKLAKMGFNDTVVNGTQSPTNSPSSPPLPGMKMPGKFAMGGVQSDPESACLPPPLLPVHNPLDLLIVCAVPNPATSGPHSVHKIRPVRAAFEHACQSLGPRDRLSLVTYEHGMGGSVRKTHFFSPGRIEGRKKLEKFIAQIACRPEDGGDISPDEFTVLSDKEAKTDMISGINVGLDTVLQRRAKNALTAVVLINDSGDVVKRASMDLVLARAEAANVSFHTIGYGKHQDSSGLWLLSNNTHGTYTFGLLGGMASVAVTKFSLRLDALDTDFKCRKISGAPHAVLSGDGKHVDIELKDLQFGQKIEVLVEMEYDRALVPNAEVPTTQQSGGDSDNHDSMSNEGHTPMGTSNQVQEDSHLTDESYGTSNTASISENLLEMSNAQLEDDVPVFEVDCTYHDPASNRSVARLSYPILLTIATAPQTSKISHKAPWADFEVARRRYELVSSESITRALLLVSRQKWTQAQRVLQETTKILSAVIRNTVDLIAKGTGTRAAVKREMQALVLLDSLRAIIEDIDVLIEGMEEEREAFERDHRNFGAQQALILRTQRSWTARTHTEGMYITEGSKEALLKR